MNFLIDRKWDVQQFEQEKIEEKEVVEKEEGRERERDRQNEQKVDRDEIKMANGRAIQI